MAATERPALVRLGPGDAAGGLALSTEALWNQTEADWRLFLTRGIVFGFRDDDDRLIATAALLPHTDHDAWISMVLVTPAWRRRGLATRLIQACLDAARARGLTTWLDATPAGAEVYGPLGFSPTLQLRRLRLGDSVRPPGPLPASCGVDTLIGYDASALGFSRGEFLRELAARPGSQTVTSASASALVREGRTARHIGPLFAASAGDALALVRGIAGHETGRLLIDAVAAHTTFLQGLANAGWTVERPFQRMRFGEATTDGSELMFAVAGPEYG